MKLLISRCLAVFAALTSLSHAQEGIKIISQWSTKWDAGSSVSYVYGDHERVEGYWGVRAIDGTSRMSSLSLKECGIETTFYIVYGETFYEEERAARSAHLPASSGSKGVIRVHIVYVDSGERELKFGLPARHIVTTEKYDFTNSSCKPDETSRKYDGWYSDWPYSNKCSKADFEVEPRFNCGDQVIVTREGTKPSGFVMSMINEIEYKNRRTVYSSNSVREIEHQKVDPALFAKPSNIHPMSEFRKRTPKADAPLSNPPN